MSADALPRPEPVLEPDLPIVDAHHHLWFEPSWFTPDPAAPSAELTERLRSGMRNHRRYLLDEFLADIESGGHDIRATVFMQTVTMYRRAGPEHLRSVGEVEFANGIAAMSASGLFGDTRVCAGIVGWVDLAAATAAETIDAQLAASPGRYRGVRSSAVAGPGAARLSALGLSLDAGLWGGGEAGLLEFARRYPDLRIVVNHIGPPRPLGEAHAWEGFEAWRGSIRAIAECPNIVVKIGGLASHLPGLPSWQADPPFDSVRLADEWHPFIETGIEAFGPDRCLFESDFPVDAGTCDYRTIWNALKRIAAPYSRAEREAMFAGTATRVYRLDTPVLD